MPSFLNLLDLAKMQGCEDGLLAVLDEAARATPELTGEALIGAKPTKIPGLGSGRTIKGINYKTLVRTGLPPFQFRNAGEGVAAGKSTYENRNFETFLANLRWQADKHGVADVAEDGPEAVLAEEALAITTATMMGLAKQFYYGRAADAKGHPGLVDSTNTAIMVNAAGTTGLTSVYAVKFGQNYVSWIFGNDAPFALDPPRIESMIDPNDATKQLTVYLQELALWAGVQVKSERSIGRIANISEEANKKLTGDMLGNLKAKWPAGYAPDCFLLTPRSLEQYRQSLQDASTTGAHVDTPSNFEGIPLVPTDNISNAEGAVVFA